MERERRSVVDRKVYNNNVDVFDSSGGVGDYFDSPVIKMSVDSSSSSAGSPTCSSSSPLSSNSNCIQHRVSRFDTLAGVAIRYGVEVADIKRLNGLVTDIQMFALKYLQIPLPGRHPPSNCLSTDSDSIGESSSERNHRRDFFDSFQSLRVNSSQRKVSPAMSSLQGFYGLKSAVGKVPEGFEMETYRKGNSHYLEDGPFIKSSPASDPPVHFHRKSRSVASDLLDENGQLADYENCRDSDSDWLNEKLVRRRQKSEADFMSRTPEKLIKEEIGGGGFSISSGKSLALRSKAASRSSLVSEAESSGMNPIPIGLGDSVVADGYVSVRKSSSTSSLQDQESSSLTSLWPTAKWSLKPDLQALSTAAITKPIFDGLPKPTRRTKTALD